MSRQPGWLRKIFDYCCAAFEADAPRIILGWQYKRPDPDAIEPAWSMIVFPTRIEIGGGPYDGRVIRPRIHVCVSHLMDLFDETPHVDWRVPPRYAGFVDAPHLTFAGEVRGRPLVLSVFDRAPRDHEVRTLFDTRTGECRRTEDCHVV